MKKIVQLGFLTFFLTVLLAPLSGCAGMNGKFDCNVDSAGVCASMDQVNALASQGHFNGVRPTGHAFRESRGVAQQSDVHQHTIYAGEPIRYGEQVQRIWIGPYEDSNGNYHEPSHVYSVVKQGRWIGDPIKAIQDSGNA